jgi:uncharacterized lipoprotein
MKHAIKVVMLALAAVFAMSACSSLSITKRRYTKGYYVEHRGKRAAQPVKHEIASNDSQKETVAVEKVAVSPEPVANVPQVTTAQAAKPAKAAPARSKRTIRSAALALNDAIDPDVRRPFKALRNAVKMASGDSGDDALSLLWIVVVVILVIYLIGLLLEWGPYTHILGVIAIVLLILWLLRII